MKRDIKKGVDLYDLRALPKFAQRFYMFFKNLIPETLDLWKLSKYNNVSKISRVFRCHEETLQAHNAAVEAMDKVVSKWDKIYKERDDKHKQTN